MAINFPNYLGAQLVKPDYSGIGDSVSNYYGGRNMRNDDLIKRIAAQFAQPNAETSLEQMKQQIANEKLTGQKSVLEIQKARRDMAIEAQMQAALKSALANSSQSDSYGQSVNSGGQLPINPSLPQPQRGAMTLINPSLPNALAPQPPANDMQGFDQTAMDPRFRKFDQAATGQPLSAYKPGADTVAPLPPEPEPVPPPPVSINGVTPEQTAAVHEPIKPAAPDEQVINEGARNLHGIDELYEKNPMAREYLEKKGFKKKVETKFDAKSGKTRILTTYPSGRMILKTIGSAGSAEDGVPLTNSMVTQHQRIIAGVDNALPIIEDILKKPDTFAGKHIQQYPRSSGWIPGTGYIPGVGLADLSNKYENQVNAAVDSLINAYGLNKSDKSTQMVHDQLLIGHNETDAAYKRRLKALVKDLERRKSYSEKETKRSNKISPISSSDSGQETYSSNEYETVNE